MTFAHHGDTVEISAQCFSRQCAAFAPGKELGNVSIGLPVLGHFQIVSVLLLKGGLFFRIFEEIFAVCHKHDAGVRRNAVELSVPFP